MGGDPLPPTGEDGDAVFTASIGWCGGHGEAVLDEEHRIRRRDGLPIYVDSRSWEKVEPLLDLAGSWSGSPFARVTAHVRLEPRSARNRTIPGAPRQKLIALVILALGGAEVIGERLEGGP